MLFGIDGHWFAGFALAIYFTVGFFIGIHSLKGANETAAMSIVWCLIAGVIAIPVRIYYAAVRRFRNRVRRHP